MTKPFNPRDSFFRRAQREGYRARSAYKLDEIQKRFRLARPGDAALDLGAAPGGFLQVLAKAVGPKGYVLGVDLEDIEPLPAPVVTWRQDVYADDLVDRLRAERPDGFDLVTSDMAPKTSGAGPTDVARSIGLAERALDIATEVLRPHGRFVAKVFMGEGFDAFVAEVRRGFRTAKIVRPEATRARSREAYVLGLERFERPRGP